MTVDWFQLGRWDLATPKPGKDEEDLFTELDNNGYTDEIDQVLSPNRELLMQLVCNPRSVNKELVPVMGYINALDEDGNRGQGATAMLHANLTIDGAGVIAIMHGNLTLEERAWINNWFATNIEQAAVTRLHWYGSVAVVHARTLLIMSRLTDIMEDMENGDLHAKLLKMAWEIVRSGSGFAWDVNREAISKLEEGIFMQTKAAGAAGNKQWGRDRGCIQDGWDPYIEVPSRWRQGGYKRQVASEDEVSVVMGDSKKMAEI